MCRDILNSCVRNTEDAEKMIQVPNGAGGGSGRGLGKGVWGMIEESELAKTIRLGEEQKVRETSPFLSSFWLTPDATRLTRMSLSEHKLA